MEVRTKVRLERGGGLLSVLKKKNRHMGLCRGVSTLERPVSIQTKRGLRRAPFPMSDLKLLLFLRREGRIDGRQLFCELLEKSSKRRRESYPT